MASLEKKTDTFDPNETDDNNNAKGSSQQQQQQRRQQHRKQASLKKNQKGSTTPSDGNNSNKPKSMEVRKGAKRRQDDAPDATTTTRTVQDASQDTAAIRPGAVNVENLRGKVSKKKGKKQPDPPGQQQQQQQHQEERNEQQPGAVSAPINVDTLRRAAKERNSTNKKRTTEEQQGQQRQRQQSPGVISVPVHVQALSKAAKERQNATINNNNDNENDESSNNNNNNTQTPGLPQDDDMIPHSPSSTAKSEDLEIKSVEEGTATPRQNQSSDDQPERKGLQLFDESNLIEATLVDEETEVVNRPNYDPPGTLVQAEPLKPQEPQNAFRDFLQSRKGRCCTIVVLLIIVVLAVGMTVGIINSRNRGPNDNFSEAPTSMPTPIPTMAPTPFNFLDRLPSDTQETVLLNNSPQSRAYAWLQNDTKVYSYSRMLQRFALASLYYSTNGENWLQADNWLSYEQDECYWYSSTDDNDVNCEEYRTLSLDSNGLRGTLPPEIGLLTSLIVLDFSNNAFTGTIPTQIGLLHRLRKLELYQNSFSGLIPSEIGSLTQLRSVVWFSNMLEFIPSEFGNLQQLTKLQLEENVLQGTLPTELGRLHQLQTLRLNLNFFTGTLPVELHALDRLRLAHLANNAFQGSIDGATFANWTSINFLNLQGNAFSGRLPSQIGALVTMKTLILSRNSFSGVIPTELGQLTNVGNMDLSENMFIGEIPSTFGHITKLSSLNLLGNFLLTGTIPSELCAMEGLLSSLDCATEIPTTQLPSPAAMYMTETTMMPIEMTSPPELAFVPPFFDFTDAANFGAIDVAGGGGGTRPLVAAEESDSVAPPQQAQSTMTGPPQEAMEMSPPEAMEMPPPEAMEMPPPEAMADVAMEAPSPVSVTIVIFSILYRYQQNREPSTDELDGLRIQTELFCSQVLEDFYSNNRTVTLYDSSNDFFEIFSIGILGNDASSSQSLRILPNDPLQLEFFAEVRFLEQTSTSVIPDFHDLLMVLEDANYNVYMEDFVINSEPFGTSIFFDTYDTAFQRIDL